MRIRTLARLLSALAGMIAVAGDAIAQQRAPEPARLGFRVCNQTASEIDVAKALNTGATDGRSRIIISEGWYKLAGGTCLFLWPGKLEYQYYLVYAQNKATNREWAGNSADLRQPRRLHHPLRHLRRAVLPADVHRREHGR